MGEIHFLNFTQNKLLGTVFPIVTLIHSQRIQQNVLYLVLKDDIVAKYSEKSNHQATTLKNISPMIEKSPNKLAELFLLAVKMEDDFTQIRLSLESIDFETFSNSINDDDKKKAFWINLYNASYQILRKEHNLEKPAIYKNKIMVIAGEKFSLDNMEHSILRKNKIKFSFGLFKNLFAKAMLKKLAVDQLDYRIHFALNCGAKSCPPIAFYNQKKIDVQLDQATQSFLEGETTFNDDQKTLRTTALFKWFSADFGGPRGIRKIFKQQLNKDVSSYKIYYNQYSWEDDLANFIA